MNKVRPVVRSTAIAIVREATPFPEEFAPTPGSFISGETFASLWLRCCATNWKVAVSIQTDVSGVFIDIKSFRSHCGLGVDSASNRNEYQEYFLRVKSGRCVRLTTLPPSCAVVTKSGNLNILEPSGPLRPCNGTALPFFTFASLSCNQVFNANSIIFADLTIAELRSPYCETNCMQLDFHYVDVIVILNLKIVLITVLLSLLTKLHLHFHSQTLFVG